MTIFDKIEKIFADDITQSPVAFEKISTQLEIIINMLKDINNKQDKTVTKDDLNIFMKKLRDEKKIGKNIIFELNNEKFSINKNGFLYYKKNGIIVKTQKAMDIYKELYLKANSIS
jgi:hypothetical protein